MGFILNAWRFLTGSSGPDYDEYWDNVVALLHMDGTDASTTFADEVGTTWTANGDAQIDTAQSKFGGASGIFDGSGDYISAPSNSNYNLTASGDFTVEFWLRLTDKGNGDGNSVVCCGSASGYWQFLVRNNLMQINIRNYNGGGYSDINAAVTLANDEWHHYAWVRTGSTYKLFYDGVDKTLTGGLPTAFTQLTHPLYIGANYNGGVSSTDGHIDDLRITKGVARYTEGFTPPTRAFYDFGGPSTFRDTLMALNPVGYWRLNESTGTRAHDISGNGYDGVYTNTPTLGEAGALINSDDTAVTFAGASSERVDMGDVLDFERTDAFSLGCWVKNSNTGVVSVIIGKMQNSGSYSGYALSYTASDKLRFTISNNASSGANIAQIDTSNAGFRDGLWHFVVCTYDGTSDVSGMSIYVDGQSQAVTTIVNTLSSTTLTSVPFQIAARDSGSNMTGSVDEAFVFDYELTAQKVLDLYHASMSSSTYDEYWDNVVMLLHMDGVDGGTTFVEETGRTTSAVGVVTDQDRVKYGSAAALFQTGNILIQEKVSGDLNYGTGAFTLETWIYPTSAGYNTIYSQRWTSGITFRTNPSNNLEFFYGAGVNPVNSTGTVSLNQWTHVAVTRSAAGVFTFWINGTDAGGTSGYTHDVGENDDAMLGRRFNQATEYFVGSIDDFRATKGVVRYTADFSPPTQAFPHPSILDNWHHNLVAMWTMDTVAGSTLADESANNHSGTITNATQVADSAVGSYSLDFDNTSDQVSIADHADFELTEFAISFWIKTTETANTIIIEKDGNAGFSAQMSNYTPGLLLVNVGGVLYVQSTVTINDGTWKHVVINYDGSQAAGSRTKIYINSVDRTGSDGTGTPSYSSGPLVMGTRPAASVSFIGKLDQVRHFKQNLTTDEINELYKESPQFTPMWRIW